MAYRALKKKSPFFGSLAVVVMNFVMFKLGLDFSLELETVIHVSNNLWAYFVSIKIVILCMYISVSKERCKGFPKLLIFFLEVCRSHSCKFLHFKNKEFTFL